MMKNVTIQMVFTAILPHLLFIPILIAQEDLPSEHREKVMERIEMMRMWKMTEDLDLTEEEGSVLFPFLRTLDEERKELNRERGRAMRELRATLRGENPNPEIVHDLLDRLQKIRMDVRKLEDREIDKIVDTLEPEQVARYIIFKQDFEREIRDIIFRARRPEAIRDVPLGERERRPRERHEPSEGYPR